MNEKQNKAVVKRFIEEMWNQRKLSLADELFASDCVTHQLRGGTDLAGASRTPQSVRQEAEAWIAGFPDLQFQVEQMFAADDRVFTHLTLRGTHTGPWMGVSPTGQQLNVSMMTVHRIDDGKIVKDWVLIGSLALFQQLGLLPDIATILRNPTSVR